MRSIVCRSLILLAGLISPLTLFAQSDLVQIHQDFSKDPGWDWKHNRIAAEDPPTIKQDFGWAETNHTGAAAAGEIGGTIWQSKTPAYYALPLNKPLSFKDKFSFSCRISFMPTGGGGARGVVGLLPPAHRQREHHRHDRVEWIFLGNARGERKTESPPEKSARRRSRQGAESRTRRGKG